MAETMPVTVTGLVTTQAATSADSIRPRVKRQFWRESLAPYEQPALGRGLLDLATAVVPYLALSGLMYLALDVSYLLTLAIAVPAAGFLMRTYILFHDCAHGSFLPWRLANLWLGRVLGVLVFSPYQAWRHNHAIHHATAGDLDRRGVGDVPTMTVAEYRIAPRGTSIGYRLFRNPLIMFGIGPIYALMIQPRLWSRDDRTRNKRSIIATNVALAIAIGLVCWAIGWQEFLLVLMPTAWLAGAAGVFLFYVQHQFEDVYWESTDSWSYSDAALRGSSHLRLPRVLRFFSGNIGLHHVHHLSARVPNYNLQRAHDENPIFHDVPTLTLADGLRCVRLKLWDEERRRLVTWREAQPATKESE